jgi:hypothetical protein
MGDHEYSRARAGPVRQKWSGGTSAARFPEGNSQITAKSKGRLLTALDAAGNQMRLDECRTWTIMGKRGYVATWGDGARWFIYCAPGSGRKWNNLRRDLSHLGKCTQGGDDDDTNAPRQPDRKSIPEAVE